MNIFRRFPKRNRSLRRGNRRIFTLKLCVANSQFAFRNPGHKRYILASTTYRVDIFPFPLHNVRRVWKVGSIRESRVRQWRDILFIHAAIKRGDKRILTFVDYSIFRMQCVCEYGYSFLQSAPGEFLTATFLGWALVPWKVFEKSIHQPQQFKLPLFFFSPV